MKKIFPEKLKKGDQAMVIAPSDSFMTLSKARQKYGAQILEKDFGLNLKYSKNLFKIDKSNNSTSIEDRLEDLINAFKDKNTKLIISARGGFNINELLPKINFDLIKENPKIIIGYSDTTALLNAIYIKTGIITYLGPTFATISNKNVGSNYNLENFKNIFFSKEVLNYTSSSKVFDNNKEYKNKGIKIIQNGHATGTLLGGNLCTFNLLQGTKFMPNLRNSILLIEDDAFGGKLSPLEFERNFESLLQSTDRSKIKGVLIGRFQKAFNMTDAKLYKIIERRNLPKNIPIVSGVDFGHTTPMTTFPIGGTVKIDANNKNIKIEILKH